MQLEQDTSISVDESSRVKKALAQLPLDFFTQQKNAFNFPN
jgi:hypothetical protein